MTEPSETEFQVTVPSNSCIEIYPANRPNHFTMEFSVKRELDDRWQVALMELQFPVQYPLITPTLELVLTFKKNTNTIKDFIVKIPAKRSKSYAEVATLITNTIAEYGIGEFKLEFESAKSQFKFTSPEHLQPTLKTITNEFWQLIGFGKKTRIDPFDGAYFLSFSGTVTGEPVMMKQYPCMYVYSDVVRQQEVGGSLQQLLETVPVNGAQSPGTQISYVVNPPRYQSVAKHLLDRIEIQINTHTGAPWPLEADDEQVIARLSFRRKPMLLFSA